MARMHTRRKGSSRSRPPFRSTPPEWCDMNKEELEKHVLRLYGNGVSPTMIGLTLRDQYGVPSVKPILGTKLTRCLRENAEVMARIEAEVREKFGLKTGEPEA